MAKVDARQGLGFEHKDQSKQYWQRVPSHNVQNRNEFSKLPYHRRSDVWIRYPHDCRHRVDFDWVRRNSSASPKNWIETVAFWGMEAPRYTPSQPCTTRFPTQLLPLDYSTVTHSLTASSALTVTHMSEQRAYVGSQRAEMPSGRGAYAKRLRLHQLYVQQQWRRLAQTRYRLAGQARSSLDHSHPSANWPRLVTSSAVYIGETAHRCVACW